MCGEDYFDRFRIRGELVGYCSYCDAKIYENDDFCIYDGDFYCSEDCVNEAKKENEGNKDDE